MSSKVRSFIESARTVNTITNKITADLLENHPSSYFAPVASFRNEMVKAQETVIMLATSNTQKRLV